MSELKRKWEKLSDEKKADYQNQIIAYFQMERGEEIGVIAAQNILDFFLQLAGKEIYNKGVLDAQSTLENRFEDLKLDLDMLLD